MATGRTSTAALQDSLPSNWASSARIVREQVGVMTSPAVVDVVTLKKNIGLSWTEPALDTLTAQAQTETGDWDNPQQLSDTVVNITPTLSGIHVIITDDVYERLNELTLAKMGELAQNAVQRKANQDGITTLDGATTSLGSAGTVLTTGHVSAAVTRITSNTTEPGPEPINVVLHGNQLRAIYSELTAGIGTYPIPAGMSAEIFQNGIGQKFRGRINGAAIWEDGTTAPDSSSDFKGGAFSKQGIVFVRGKSPWMVVERNEKIGAGANEIIHRDMYAYGQRSPGNWLFELYFDAANPTS